MTALFLTEAQADEYLAVLDVSRQAPSRRALDELVQAQATSVPFENISKLLYRRRRNLRDVPDLALYLDGIRRHHFGGTCYANAFHFHSLLRTLGYRAALCGAAMASGEDVHIAITVALDGHDLLVDVGYGAPFLQPLPLDRNDNVTVRLGRDRFVLEPRDREGRSRLVVHRDGELLHGYHLNPAPRAREHFDGVVRESFRDSATFMNAVMLVRHSATGGVVGSVGIYNDSLVRSTADRCIVERLAGRPQLVDAIEREFGIPAEIARETIADLGVLADLYD